MQKFDRWDTEQTRIYSHLPLQRRLLLTIRFKLSDRIAKGLRNGFVAYRESCVHLDW